MKSDLLEQGLYAPVPAYFTGQESGWEDVGTNLVEYKNWIFSFLEIPKKQKTNIGWKHNLPHRGMSFIINTNAGILPKSCTWKEKAEITTNPFSNTKIHRPKRVKETWEKDKEKKTNENKRTVTVQQIWLKGTRLLLLPLLLFLFFSLHLQFF